MIGVNDSGLILPVDEIFSLDQPWIRQRQQQWQGQNKKVVLAVPDGHGDIAGATVLKRVRKDGMALEPTEISGLNSGFGSLNYAVHKRPSTIYLLGFDMGVSGDEKHWYSEYPWRSNTTDRHYGAWIDQFLVAKKQCDAVGVMVKTVGPTKITAFDNLNLEYFERKTLSLAIS